ncbi:MAG: hypothetical protein J2P17_28460 [Mycobacterium sp.]|nr:hypothetical protein [Mycobacterium sp.]
MPAAGQYGIVRVDDVNAAGYNQITGPFEIIQVGSNNTGTNTLSSLTRAQEGTSAHAFAAGSVWSQVFTAGGLRALTMVKIDEQNPTGASATFSSIPQTYSALRITGFGRSVTAASFDTLILRFNGDTTTTYYNARIAAAGSSAAGDATPSNQAWSVLSIWPAATAGGSVPGYLDIALPGYFSSTFQKAIVTPGAGVLTASSYTAQVQTSLWAPASPTAVTSITLLFVSNANFVSGSRFCLFGIP